MSADIPFPALGCWPLCFLRGQGYRKHQCIPKTKNYLCRDGNQHTHPPSPGHLIPLSCRTGSRNGNRDPLVSAANASRTNHWRALKLKLSSELPRGVAMIAKTVPLCPTVEEPSTYRTGLTIGLAAGREAECLILPDPDPNTPIPWPLPSCSLRTSNGL